MQVSTNRAKPKALRKTGADPAEGTKRKGPNGGRQVRASTAPATGIGLHILERQLQSKTLMELALNSGALALSVEEGLLSMIDSEEKQLLAIEDLYAILIAQPQYKKLESKSWNEKTEPIQVLLWILRKLGALAKGENWTIDTYKEGRKTRYQFVVYKNFTSNWTMGAHPMKEGKQFVALEFLPHLLKRDKPLHDIIVDTIALVSKKNKVPFWWEDGDYSDALQTVLADRYYENAAVRDRTDTYRKGGRAVFYQKLFTSRRRFAKAADIEEQIRNYKATSNRKDRVIGWAKQGLRIADTGLSIERNIFIPSYTSHALLHTPQHNYKFLWCEWDNDPVHETALRRMRKRHTLRWSWPFSFAVTKPGTVMKELKTDPFAPALAYFMYTGDMTFSGNHKEYFYNPVLDERGTRSKPTLMEQLIQIEL